MRLGTPEVTRLGMKEKEMDRVAELFHQLLHQGRPTAEVRQAAADLKKDFRTLQYCFGAGEAAYRYYELVRPS